MARSKKPLPILKNITITDFAAEGKSLVRYDVPAHDGQPESRVVIFVPFCVPGDVVDLQVRHKKHNFWEAEVARFIKFSPNRPSLEALKDQLEKDRECCREQK